MFIFALLFYAFGFVLVLLAIFLIVEGIGSNDKKKIAKGAALGLGAAAGMHHVAKKRNEAKEQQKRLRS